jgi:hypothetical protein
MPSTNLYMPLLNVFVSKAPRRELREALNAFLSLPARPSAIRRFKLLDVQRRHDNARFGYNHLMGEV